MRSRRRDCYPRGGIAAAASSRGKQLFCLQARRILCVGVILTAPSGTQNHLPSSRLVAECKTYRGFAPASPNPAGSLSSTQSKRKSTPIGVLFLFGRGRRVRCALGFCRRLRAVSGKTFVLPTSQFQNAIAHFGLLRRTGGFSPTIHSKIKNTTVLVVFFILAERMQLNPNLNLSFRSHSD